MLGDSDMGENVAQMDHDSTQVGRSISSAALQRGHMAASKGLHNLAI